MRIPDWLEDSAYAAAWVLATTLLFCLLFIGGMALLLWTCASLDW